MGWAVGLHMRHFVVLNIAAKAMVMFVEVAAVLLDQAVVHQRSMLNLDSVNEIVAGRKKNERIIC